ncbi:ABC-type lipoprotein export system ATPase subunit [Kaistia hirudinis]|uniref:ABC-type lipoprotein export system ATPase subunit n=2 Tax=Kaistia hirudinis TaxID=1293440 RepID=A0A840ARY8_9HYPH|nr:ABC-type lipoprotein export system ATPase subunit [Kaistia hirudinis]
MLMQMGNLVDHLTVAQNIRLQRSLAGQRERARLPELLASIGIGALGDSLPSQLSGGESARAGLCVALASEPFILICDEPTAEVDAETEKDVITVLRQHCSAGACVIVATHSDVLARAANRCLSIRDGRLVA